MATPKALVLNNIGGGIGVRVERLPLANETIMMKALEPPGEDLAKGGNVAVALSRLGVPTAIIGKIGKDEAGDRDRRWLEEAGVDLSVLIQSGEVSTGQGIGILADNGDVMLITGVSSSRALTEGEVFAALERYRDAQYLLCGYEVRPELVNAAARKAKSPGIKTALNPSPIPAGGLEEAPYADYLFVNEVEGQIFTGREVSREFEAEPICREMLERYRPGCVVLTMGDRGSAYMTADGEFRTIAPVPAKAVDSAGAGDGFMAATVARLIRGDSLYEACCFASGYAAYSVTKYDCLPGYPTVGELEAFLRSQPAG